MEKNEQAVRRRLRPEERRDELLGCAFDIVLAKGLEALTMEGLAAQAQVNKALPYHYFVTRDGVLAAVADNPYIKLYTEFQAASESVVGLDARMKALIECWIDLAPQWRVIKVLETVRSRIPELNAVLTAYEARVALLMTQLFSTERGVRPDMGLMLAASVVGSAQGVVWAWETSGWTRKKLVSTWLKMNIAAVDAVTAKVGSVK